MNEIAFSGLSAGVLSKLAEEQPKVSLSKCGRFYLNQPSKCIFCIFVSINVFIY
jgi:hypothetical protein